jgi:hypothetical protein
MSRWPLHRPELQSRSGFRSATEAATIERLETMACTGTGAMVLKRPERDSPMPVRALLRFHVEYLARSDGLPSRCADTTALASPRGPRPGLEARDWRGARAR